MTANRRADLQRKLSLAPVAKPPADLVDRIKSEIPKELRFSAEAERARFSKSVTFSLRVAASILLVVSASYLGLRLLSPAREPIQATPPPVTAAVKTDSISAVARAKVAENEPLVLTDAKSTKATTRKPQSTVAALQKKVELRDDAKNVAKDIAFAPAPAAPPPSAAAEAAPLAAQEARPRREMAMKAARVALPTPPPQPLDDEVVQRFAAPSNLETGKVVLDVEAAQNPIIANQVIIRASIDSGVVARRVHLEIVPPDQSMYADRLALSWDWREPEVANRSRTSLVDTVIPTDQTRPLATIRVSYHRGDDPNELSIERTLRAADIKPWVAASRRTQAGFLASMWKLGWDRATIIRIARAAGIDDLIDEMEKP